MKLLNLDKKLFFSLFLYIFFTPVLSEDSVDIWKKNNLKINKNINKSKDNVADQVESKIKILSEPPKEIDINTNNLDASNNLIYGILSRSAQPIFK